MSRPGDDAPTVQRVQTATEDADPKAPEGSAGSAAPEREALLGTETSPASTRTEPDRPNRGAPGPENTQEEPLVETGDWAQAHGSTLRPSGGVTRLGAASATPRGRGESTDTHGFAETPTRPDLATLPSRTTRTERYRPLVLGGPVASARTFATLVPTQHNGPIFELAEQVARERSYRFNPVYLWSDVPLGKSHVLEAMAMTARGRGRIVLTNAVDLEAEFERAAHQKLRAELRRWLVGADLLLIDDVHRLQGGSQELQLLLASVVDAMVSARTPVVLAANGSPATLGGLESALRARLGAGIVLELVPPEPRERIGLLAYFLGEQPAEMEVLARVADAAGGDLRALRALANQLLANAALWDLDIIDLPLAERVIRKWRGRGGPSG